MPRKSLTKNKEKVLVLDADSSVYAVGFMTQKKTHLALDGKAIKYQDTDKRKYNKWIKENDPEGLLDYDYTEEIEPISYALSSCKKFVANTLEFTGCDRVILLLTKGGNCFRHHLATIQKYKGNRDGMSKPHHYDAIRQYYTEVHGARMYRKWEADDAACMCLHRGSGDSSVDYILSSIDKDLDQQYGLHVNPGKKDEGVYVIDEVTGWYNFYIQMLMGDKADNIKCLSGKKGSPGIGKKGAEKLLADVGDDISLMCQIVYDQYVIRYGADEFTYEPWWVGGDEFPEKPRTLRGTALSMFRENADLLYMLRTPHDQYLPHSSRVKELWGHKYPEGTAYFYLPKEDDDESQES